LPVCEGVVITHYNDPLVSFWYYLWRPLFLFLCEVSGSDFLWNPSDVTCICSRASLLFIEEDFISFLQSMQWHWN